MMKSTSVWLLIALLALAGCQGKKATETADAGASDSTKVTQKGPDEKGLTPEDVKRMRDKQSEGQKEAFEIKTDQEIGFRSSPKETELGLGQKIDQAFAQTEPTVAQVTFEMNDAGARTTAIPIIKIQDRGTYSIEYVTPDYPQSVSRLISNNGTTAHYQNLKFHNEPVKPLPNKLGKKELEQWMSDFPEQMFAGFGDGDKHWSKVIAALQDPKNGFETTISEKVSDVRHKDGTGKLVDQNLERAFYRVVAKSKDGKSEIEIKVDSRKYFPVTIRTNQVLPDGKERQILWNAQWALGGEFKPTEFQIPNAS